MTCGTPEVGIGVLRQHSPTLHPIPTPTPTPTPTSPPTPNQVDIGVLRQHTRYGVSVDPNDAHIAILWEVLTSFTMEQRSMCRSSIGPLPSP